MDYERGLDALKRLGESQDWYSDFTVYEARLRDNLSRENQYGSTDTTRADRAFIVHALNRLAIEHVGMSFNDLCLGKIPHAGRGGPGGGAGAQGASSWDTATVRQLLNAAFNDEDLMTLCFDHFQPVYEKFSGGMSKGQKILMLLDYCERRDEVGTLLKLVEKLNPAQYGKFKP